MAIIYYIRHRFQDPQVITLDQYHQLKQQWAADPGYNPGNLSKTAFTRFFRKRLWWIVGCSVALLILYPVYSYLYPDPPNGLVWDRATIGGSMFLVGGIGFFILVQVFLEGPSYATFLTDRQRYFTALAQAIKATPDYQTFYKSFYPYMPVKDQQMVLPLKTSAIDRLLTSIFYWIDRHMWKVILLLLALFLLNKYVFKVSLWP